MLSPQDRRLFLDLLRPPVHETGVAYRLDLAIGTTYSLDLIAMLAAPVAMAFADWQDRDGRPVGDPLALLKAVRQYADRICLFCQAGKIYVPKHYQPLLVNLESSIVQAVAPQGGSFHPKVWVLRFEHPESPSDVIYRVLCLSRNLTFDRSWDTLLSLEGPLKQRTNAISRNHPLGEFVESLTAMANPKLSATWNDRVKQIAHELRRVELETPPPFEDLKFVPMGIANATKWPFPDQLNKLLVVSPFVDDGCVKDLAWHESPMQLVARPESLALLSQASIDAFEKVWTLDETAEPEASEAEQAMETATAEPQPQEIPLVGLHAKVYVGDYGARASVWTGSANATKTAFERNVEFLVELLGKRSLCGVDAVLGKQENAGPKRAGSLADMLQPYSEHIPASATQLAEVEFERLVDRFARSLIVAAPAARCLSLDSPEVFRIQLDSQTPLPAMLMGASLRVWPASLHESNAQPADGASTTWCSFEPVSVDALTSFFAFELTSVDGKIRRSFILNLPLIGAPDNRRERILRNLLDSPQKLLRFLLMLLLNPDNANLGGLLAATGAADKDKLQRFEFLESTLLESLLRALDRDPSRIDQVAGVIEDLLQTPEGRTLLPNNFESVWLPIWEVRQKQLAAERATPSTGAAAATEPPAALQP